MDGRNCSGARISLLNDCSVEGPAARQPTSLAHHSRTSSFASTPILSSPPTPKLVRSDSSDSSDSTTMQRTPSPITPINFGFDSHAVAHQHKSVVDSHYAQHPSFFTKQPSTSYPPIGQHSSAAAFAYPTDHPGVAPQLYAAPDSSRQQPQQQNGSSSTAKAPGKKNSYPCPLAKEYNCSHFFTTSGHAARHAKKHTGKKDAFCPECNKAFTRKDNMEQHRRTHQNGRNASKSNGDSSSTGSNKRQKTASSAQARRPKPPSLQASAPVLDPSLPLSPASSYGYPDAPFGIPSGLPQAAPPVYPPELLGNSPFATASPYALGPYYDSSNMSGLDKLAMAASGERHGNADAF